jgi:hypothetical protein
MQQESIDFINLLATRARSQKRIINPFNAQHWFQGAYRTIQRRVPVGKFQPAQKKNCQNLIFASLPQLTPVAFDTDIKKLIADVAAKFPLSIGQSQKLVNILLKYHACLFYSQFDLNWNAKNLWVKDIHAQQHVPIDTVVLFELCRNDPASCSQFVTARSYFSYDKVATRFMWHYTAKIYVPASPTGTGTSVPWSKINDYADYFRLQTMIRTLAKAKRVSPLLYEMQFLWAPQ